MEVQFSEQANKIINQLNNKEEVRKKLIELANKRQMIITGGDIMMYLIKGELMVSLKTGVD